MKASTKITNDVATLDYISRYAPFPTYYSAQDEKYVKGLTKNLSKTSSYVEVEVTQSTTLDMLSLKHYGRPDYFWVIADFNSIQDPFIPIYPKYKKLKIPSIININYTYSNNVR